MGGQYVRTLNFHLPCFLDKNFNLKSRRASQAHCLETWINTKETTKRVKRVCPWKVGIRNGGGWRVTGDWYFSSHSHRLEPMRSWGDSGRTKIPKSKDAQVPYVSVQFSHSVMSDSLWSHGLQHTRLPCPSPTPKTYSNSCPLSGWCHPTISSSVVPFFSRLQSFPASGSFPGSRLFTSGGQSTGVSASASVLPMNIQDWFALRLIGWISL